MQAFTSPAAAAFREMADAGGFDLGRDVLPRFVGRMRGWVHEGYHVDVGTIEALARANQDAAGINAQTSHGRRWPSARRCSSIETVSCSSTLITSRVSTTCDSSHGAPDAVIALRRAGFACVVVSSQSTVGRELVTVDQVAAVNERMCRLFAADGAVFDAVYSLSSWPRPAPIRRTSNIPIGSPVRGCCSAARVS